MSSVAELLAEVVRVPSVNPLQAGPRANDDGERAIAEWLADRCDALGADVDRYEVVDDRPNVEAVFPGTGGDLLTIDVHLDTVGVEHMTRDPFDGAIGDDGRVYGRGSVDTKATLAVVLTVLDELHRAGRRPGPSVRLVGTISEEIGGLLGAGAHAERRRARGERLERLVIAEPTRCAPVHGHKGGVGLEVSLHGHAAHSSKPHLGRNAVSAAARVVVALDAEADRLTSLPTDTPVGRGSLSVTEIRGGLARNIVPDACELYAGRRLAPGEDPEEEFERLSAVVREAAGDVDVTITMPYGRGFPAFYTDPQADLVQLLVRLAGEEPETAEYGSNALQYGDVADQIVLFGPGSIDQAHQAVEWVEIAELERAADVYRRLLA